MDDPYGVAMGFRAVRVEAGEAVYEADVDARFHNPTGRLHGGVISGLADAAMGAAYLAGVSDGASGTNMDLAVRFLRPVMEGRLRAEARTIQRGRRVALMTCDVWQGDRLIATAQSQFIVV